jgi:alkylhydroperoxidase family enzyme
MAADKQAAVWEFETSPVFSPAERAALRFARGAAMTPSQVTDAEFADLRMHFDDAQILELSGVIGLFGFLNRWNASLATPLEDEPLRHARETLSDRGWQAGKHEPA